MNNTTNALNWFEIPATDHNRAKAFYEAIFGIKMEHMKMDGIDLVMFPNEQGSGKAAGAIAQSPMHKPSAEGALIYLNANEQGINNVMDKVAGAGGKVDMKPVLVNDNIGYMAFLIDTEGNRVGVHSTN